ncbi:uncharacterized protein LOC116340076 isoform X2 [Contarinia nasturtii]|nr:uncharacterized protein LOC116340076 isoform X2 [Contarinia nasturtii]
MQDISRDELTLLQTGCDKDAILTNNESAFDRIKLGRTPELESLPTSIKLEDTTDAFQWNTPTTNIGSNLLHSDDPLISGALDDNQNEFDTIAGCGNSLVPMETPTSTFNKKSTRVRKSGNLKLRFHHQALPQEYLDHYEATQNHFNTKEMTLGTFSSSIRSSKKDRTATSTLQTPSTDHAANQSDASDTKGDKSVQMWLQKSSKHQNGRDSTLRMENDGNQSKGTVAKHSAKVTAQDLPYMGEITLDNFKPRRGRKPKKADICHLIYKNYGTIFPNQKTETETELESETPNNTKTLINRSLLERRLIDSGDGTEVQLTRDGDDNTEEPLNLCVRDRYDSDVMTVVSDEDGTDSEKKFADSKADMPLLSTNEPLSTAHFPRNLKMALPNFQSALLDNKHELPETAGIDMETDINNYNCWQNSGMFLNPMVLYLQKIANSNSNTPSPNYGQRASESPKPESTESSTSDTNSMRTRQRRMLVPKKMSQLMKEEATNSVTNQLIQSVTPTTVSASISNKATITSNANQKHPNAPKRKRSAIFIPPVPEESSTNHATEVSICKFKFTGGAKPSLQEKKMLSVDAGGNFRYYSGTGDKSIRFFPRESLKQSSLMTASSAGAFLNTPGQKITNDIPPPSFGLSNELLQIHEINTPSSVGAMLSSETSIPSHQQQLQQHPKQQHYHNTRKRKSKRSMQREKLEKTFKEKGFLIQTQQLEQAEGTYCKFRQLRKFTRYLFRSWKDYLPELQQNQANPAAAALHQARTPSIIDAPSPNLMPPSPSSSHED